jgi:Asp-tRNA(Asn)/Glu-tRNA(Gln) amidotransferase A subunit family amidase
VPTTAGSRALAATAAAAERGAPCLAGARAAGARIVGKANLDELAYSASGVNESFGTPAQLLQARAEQERWRAVMAAAMRETSVLALATVPFFPPRLEAASRPGYIALTSPVNLAAFPALALPAPTGQRLPASLQLIGAPNAEALLLATAAVIEAAV